MLQGAEGLTQAIREEISLHHADSEIHTTRTLCNGRCEDACTVVQYPAGLWYKNLTPSLGRQLVRELLNVESTLQRNLSYVCEQDQLVATGLAALGTNKQPHRASAKSQ
ncbi:ferredoxin [Paenibacillus alkaliterrae]